MRTVSVARDFTRYPSGRFKQHSKTSGEEFRQRFLESPILSGEQIEVDLDDTIGFGSSFLEEAFGGLVRQTRLGADAILARIQFKSADSSLIDEILEYIREADRQKDAAR